MNAAISATLRFFNVVVAVVEFMLCAALLEVFRDLSNVTNRPNYGATATNILHLG